jgi:hypothetical protein
VSRAKHGLFILGNAPQLACQSTLWWDTLNQLREAHCMGTALPLMCEVHRDVESLREPEDLAKFAPLGELNRDYC